MNTERLKETLIKHEGVHLKPYQDTAGKLTIGIGRNLDDVGISKEEAGLLLLNDIDRAVDALNSNFKWFPNLSDVRQEVLVNMCFNLGIKRLLNFKKFLIAVENRKWNIASVEMLDSLWAKQVGNRAKELANAFLLDHF